MPLLTCGLCGKLYSFKNAFDKKGICLDCLQNLDELYSHIHKYIAKLGEIKNVSPQSIADETGMKLEDVNLLFELGFFERDIQTYSHTTSERQKLAEEFEHELHDMKAERRANTYGGMIYRRKKN